MGKRLATVEVLGMTRQRKPLGRRDFWQDRPVLVTGATGLVGSSLVSTLIGLDANVVCLMRDWVPQSELVRTNSGLSRIQIARGDVRNQALVERIMGDYEIDTVFHLAAQAIVTVANRNPVETFESNIAGTWVLLEAARRSPTVKHIVTASSDKAYGDPQLLPYTEDMPLRGRHPYDVSKSCADLIAQSYAYSYSTPVVVTRCGNFFGRGDLNWNRIVPGTIRSIIRGKRPIIRSDGTCIRDYIYVDDAVGAYVLLAEKLAQMPELKGEAFNFSNENQVTARALVDKIIHLMRADVEADVRNETSNEIRDQYLDAGKARRVLGWQPSYTLEESLKETISWYRDFFGIKE